jgi:rhodanese-related sulfurtransferase
MSLMVLPPSEVLQKLKSKSGKLIDVRTPAEYESLHAEGAVLMPLDKLDPQALKTNYPDNDFYVICRSGGRGKQACEKLQAAGIDRVINVEGGTLAWEKEGLPVIRGRQTMSLERQVRIAAGSLVVMGLGLGYFIHQAFFGISAFVGCGLVFAGLTDTCGMGMILAKMPWNNRKPVTSCQVS